MNIRRHLPLFAAAAATSCVLAAPSAADAAVCFKSLSAGGTSFAMKKDGSQNGAAYLAGGSNFDANHGRLTVYGNPYPAVEDDTCTTTATSITYPARTVAPGVVVSRHVSTVSGRIRWIDTIYNSSNAYKLVEIDFALRVLGSQRSIASEVGDSDVTTHDRWSVHENDGDSFPFLAWSKAGDGAFTPEVVSLGNDPTTWKHQAGVMPDADLHYMDVPIPAGKSIQLLHTGGTTTSQAASTAAAGDGAAPFADLTREDALRMINWGNDPDGDGVSKATDECPGVKGNNPKGCFTLEAEPVNPAADQPPGGGQDAGTPPGTTPPAQTPGGPGAARDTRAPRITITKLRRSVKRGLLTGRGLKPGIACDEACSLRVQVKVRKRGSRRATTLLTARTTRSTTAARTVRLKLKAARLRRLARPRVTVIVTATDAAGNRSSVTRVVRLSR